MYWSTKRFRNFACCCGTCTWILFIQKQDIIFTWYHIFFSYAIICLSFWIGLFFVIWSKNSWKKFLKQSYRLLVPFLIMGLIYAFTIRKGESFLQQPYKLGLWYLFFLWQCYFITHLYNIVLLPFAKKKCISYSCNGCVLDCFGLWNSETDNYFMYGGTK